MSKFKVGDKVRLNRNFIGISKETVFTVTSKISDNVWIHVAKKVIDVEYLNRYYLQDFDLVEEPQELEITVKVLPSWMKESYYTHYIEIVTDFIKGYANDHHISVVESEDKDTVLTATPIKKGN